MTWNRLSEKQDKEESNGELPDVANVGIDREDLPQIESDPENREKFFEYLRKNHIHVVDSMFEIKNLKPIQGEFNMEKVDSMMNSDFKPEEDPILVSGDGYILDGHHRWVAAWNLGMKEMAVQQLGANLNEALDIMREYPGAFYKKIDEWVPDDSTMPAYNMKKTRKRGRNLYTRKTKHPYSGLASADPGQTDHGIYE